MTPLKCLSLFTLNHWQDGSTALIKAAGHGHADVVQLLIDYKANVNAIAQVLLARAECLA